jgi:CHASE2 domain-containing sensor protein
MTLPKAYAITGSSVLVLILGGILTGILHDPKDPNNLATLCFQITCGAFVVLFLTGMAVWAGAKGWHPIIGVLLGLFCSLIGLAILLFLPDKSAKSNAVSDP